MYGAVVARLEAARVRVAVVVFAVRVNETVSVLALSASSPLELTTIFLRCDAVRSPRGREE